MFDVKPLGITGCYELQPNVQEDLRGRFVKVFHTNEFERRNLAVDFNEEYYSYSTAGEPARRWMRTRNTNGFGTFWRYPNWFLSP